MERIYPKPNMSFYVVTVKFSSEKNCFVALSKIESNTPSQDVQVFEIDGRFVSWSGEVISGGTDTDGVLKINGLFAEKLGLRDTDQVILRPHGSIPNCVSVNVEAVTTEDWEIFDRHSAAIENHLLDQLRVVQSGQVYPIWVEKSVCIFIKIGSMKPEAECTLLVNETAVIVKPKVTSSSIGQQPVHEPITRKISENLDVPYINYPLDNDDEFDQRFTSTDSERSDKDYTDSGKMMDRKSREKSPYEQFSISNHWKSLFSMLGFRNYDNAKVSVSDEDDFYYDEADSLDMFEHTLQNGLNLVLRVQYLKYTPKESDLYSETGESMSRRGSSSPRKSNGSTTPRRMSRDSPTKSRKSSSLKSKFRVNYFPQQPSTVYVYMTDVEKQLRINRKDIPHVFLAKLHKLSSPKEQQQEKLNNSSGRNSPRKDSKPVEKERSPGSMDSLNSADFGERSNKDTEFPVVVRVVVLDKRRQLCNDHFSPVIKRILAEQPMLKGHVIIPDMLRRYLKLDVTSRVWLQTWKAFPVRSGGFSLYPLGNIPKKLTGDMVTLAFRDWLDQVSSEDYPMVVFQGLFVKFEVFPDTFVDTQIVFTELDSPRGGYCYTLLHPGALRHTSLNAVTWGRGSDQQHSAIQPMLAYMSISSIDPCVPSTTLDMIGGMSELVEDALSTIEICLGSRPLHREVFLTTPGLLNGMLLLTGPKGSGKTTLARALCRKMAELPNLAYTTTVECKPLRGKKVDTIQKIFEMIFDEAAWRQPALILLDDLDHVAGAPAGPEFEMSGEALYAARIAEVVKDLLRKDIRNMTRVAVLATSQSRSSLNPILTTSRGTHLIQEVLCINPPDQSQRRDMLRKIMMMKPTISNTTIDSFDLDLDQIARQTQGYVARDLENVVNRAIHAHILTQGRSIHSDHDVRLTDDDFHRAIDGFTPASIRNVSLHQAGELGWEDIGGLTDVKQTLVETLQWPAKYPVLFASCPLRLRSGLLLYGAPGTGKTLIAGVVARECGLNFISIKGPELLSKYIGASEQAVRDTFISIKAPELLSKYIGASEQAVRDTFIRAQSARPCILFFDEFDSIAPRRGHDNTGVTDRVVNQLLTQLDGVEGLEGVYVLAATSRPDLIDPALLRPGRLDKALLCQLPNEEERFKILKALSRKMRLADDIDFDYFAKNCEDYTGADFKALLYNGQLEAIHEITSQDGMEGGGGGDPGRFGMKSKRGRVTNLKSRGLQMLSPTDERRERSKSFSAGTFAYIPSLEKGVVQVSTEMEEKLSTQVNQIRLRERRSSEHIPADDLPESPYGVNKMIQVGQKHLLAAAEKMRPSVSGDERLKYERIYENFVQSRGGNFDMGFLEAQSMKATLA